MPTTQYFQTRDSNGTSNLNHLLPEHAQKIIEAITPMEVESIFGPGQSIDIPEKGYTDPEWYFEGPGDTVLGIGWRYGSIRVRGSFNINKQFISGPEICKTFLTELVEHFNNFMLIKE